MAAADPAALARINQLLPKLLPAFEPWHVGGVRVFLQRYYYCTATEAGYAVGSHVHDWFELSQLESGRVEYTDAGKSLTLGRNEVFFMAPGYEHRWRVVEAPVVISSFQLKISPLNDDGRRLIGALDSLSHRHAFRFKKSRTLTRLADEWRTSLAAEKPSPLVGEKTRAFFHLYVAQFLEETLGAALPAPVIAPAGDADGLSRESNRHIAEFIQKNLHQPIQLEDIASHFHYSVRHINRLFQREHGISIGQYILEQKLRAAQEQLATTERPVKHIALGLGYADVGYFCRLFRVHLTSTPTEYRDKLRGQRTTAA